MKREECVRNTQTQGLLKYLSKSRVYDETEKMAYNPEYEYDTVVINDNRYGAFNISAINQTISEHAQRGWRLVFMLSNGLGVKSSSIGYGGMSSGTNSTIDQQVLVFERMVRPAIKTSIIGIENFDYSKVEVEDVVIDEFDYDSEIEEISKKIEELMPNDQESFFELAKNMNKYSEIKELWVSMGLDKCELYTHINKAIESSVKMEKAYGSNKKDIELNIVKWEKDINR